jgi:endo-1,3-1,4-beta-glycanase ExoK
MIMKLLLDNTPSSGKLYSSGEIQTLDTAHYGSYRVRMKPAKGSGLITSFFTYALSGNAEIDVEFLGKNPTQVEFNYYTNGVGDHETVHDLGYDASMSFHEYGFDWAPGSITWFVDGIAVHTETGTRGPLPTEASPIFINLWSVNSTGEAWAGAFTYTGPVSAEYTEISFLAAP